MSRHCYEHLRNLALSHFHVHVPSYRGMRSRSLAASLPCRRREANPNQCLGSSKNVVTIMGKCRKCGCFVFDLVFGSDDFGVKDLEVAPW